jgi:hypothetical protein
MPLHKDWVLELTVVPRLYTSLLPATGILLIPISSEHHSLWFWNSISVLFFNKNNFAAKCFFSFYYLKESPLTFKKESRDVSQDNFLIQSMIRRIYLPIIYLSIYLPVLSLI